ncbi:MAG TPA: methyltransferase domain-containing protein [Acidimicrobiales bacterium]|nr:methyltransferase domain-containing protein [Acidimicrobiales bacterium]
MDPAEAPTDPLVVRRRFAAHLAGQGIEVGPGHVPFPVPPTVTVRYVDRWEPDENSSLFPELGDSPGFPKPDIVANLDAERLSGVPDASQDFVIASHVIEHLANPLAMIVEFDRVLRPGGLLLMLVPDRRKTFDRHRSPTPLAHLVDEYRRDVRVVDDDHVLDYMIGTRDASDDTRDVAEFTVDNMAGEIETHRRRSVHAHVWNPDEFGEVLAYAARELGVCWDVVDVMESGAQGTHGDEFGWVFAKAQPSARRSGRRRPWRAARRGRSARLAAS